LIKLQNGETRAMKNIELGDILINGSIVKATMQIKNENDPYYKIPSKDLNTDILVTGSHYIQSSTRFIRVSKFNGSVATQKIDPVVNCIITSDHKVPIGEYIFWDWEDQYVN
jgi:archaellum component FlaF (FlaF/FlaG flagellin family)